MEDLPIPRIMEVNVIKNGVLVVFGNGEMRFYSADLLYAKINDAKPLSELPWMEMN